MATTEKLVISATETTLMAGVTIAASQNAISASFSNAIGGTGDGYAIGRIKVQQTWATGAALNTGLNVWFLKSSDGSTFEDGATGTGYTPLRLPDLVFPAETGTVIKTMSRDVLLPAGLFKVLVQNPTATGQSLTTFTLTVTPITRQSI